MQQHGIGLAKAHDALASPACDDAFIDPRNWLGTGGPADRPWLPSNLSGLEVLCPCRRWR